MRSPSLKTRVRQINTITTVLPTGSAIWFFHAQATKRKGKDPHHNVRTMPEPRLTKAEKKRLLDQALREKTRRRAANRKARETRLSHGRHRLEKTVPVKHLEEIRQIVTGAVALLQVGLEPQFRCVEASSSDTPAKEGASTHTLLKSASPPGSRGLGPKGRKRAQAARRRAKQRAAGLTRTTFEVHATLMPRVSLLVDQLAQWFSEGYTVILEDTGTPDDPVQPTQTPIPTRCPTFLDPTSDQPAGDQADGEDSPLFNDIQAVARLEQAQICRDAKGGDGKS